MPDAFVAFVRDETPRRRHPADWADDPRVFAVYLAALRTTGLSFSRDDLERLTYWVTTRKPQTLDPVTAAVACAAELSKPERRIVVALTWPRRFEMEVRDGDEFLKRTAYQLFEHVRVNLATIAWRWARSNPPDVDGAPVELGSALQTLGPNGGISPALSRRLIGGFGAVIAMDELLEIASIWRLRLANEVPDGTSIRLVDPTGRTGEGWIVDAAALVEDLYMERRLLAYRTDLAREWRNQRPDEIHRLRVAPFGPPPAANRRYYQLFQYLDEQTANQFTMTIDQLDAKFAGSFRHRTLPKTARHQRGWWSNPRANRAGKFVGVGGQPQRIAWRAAGYETTRIQTIPNKQSTSSSDKELIQSVTFRAIPGRFLWHPFRAQLRAGRPDPLSYEASVLEEMARHDVLVLRWYDVVLADVLGRRPAKPSE